MDKSNENNLLKWYFSRGIFSFILVPLFFILAAITLYSFYIGGVQVLAYAKLLYAYLGWVGIVIMVFFLYFLLLPLASGMMSLFSILAPAALASSSKSRIDATWKFILALVVLQLVSNGIAGCNGYVISKIADINPATASKAGVIGSKLP